MGPAYLLQLSLLACTGAPPPVHTDSATTPAPDSGDTAPADTGRDTAAADTGDSAIDTAPPPVDADLDGYFDDVDCDDTDPEIHPGAADPCDAVDQNCDGVSYSAGTCGSVEAWAAAAESGDAGGFAVLAVDDMTGDGLPERLVRVTDLVFSGSDGGAAWGYALYANVASREPSAAPAAMLGCVVHSYDGQLHPIGDVNGDGLGDLMDEDLFDGVFGIILAPLLTDGSCFDIREGYDEVYFPWWWGEPGVGEWATGGDMDGDGTMEFVASEFGDPTVFGEPTALVDVFRGGEFGDPRARIITNAGFGGQGTPNVLEDLDGDGLAELAASRTGTGADTLVISGPDALGGDGANGEDLAILTLDSGDLTPQSHCEGLRTAGDWTGDGTADLLISYTDSDSLGYVHGEVMVFDGTTRGNIDTTAAVGSWVGAYKNGNFAWTNTGDFDCDGEQELVVFFITSFPPDEFGTMPKGKTFVPSSGGPDGAGVFVRLRETAWMTVAHELGHLLGLPHCPAHGYTDPLMPDGTPFPAYCFAPFEPDAGDGWPHFANNFMLSGIDNDADPASLRQAQLTDNQILRMRLTIVSGLSRFAEGTDIQGSAANFREPRTTWFIGDLSWTVASGLA